MNKSTMIAVVAFTLGFAAFLVLVRPDPYSRIHLVPYHWKRVDEYRKYMNDTSNYKDNHQGLVGAQVPFSIEPSLSYLAAVGELREIDVVLPKVPYKSKFTKHWIRYLNEHADRIIHGTGNPQAIGLEPTGEQPLHFQLWFRPDAAPLVRQLIDELEALSEKDRLTIR